MGVKPASAALLAAALVLAGCPRSNDASEPELRLEPAVYGGSFRVGVVGEPSTLDPYARSASDLTFALARPVYPSLFRLLPDGRAVPELARDLEQDGRVARVELHPARWSDGRAITADDVVASARRARPPSALAELRARALGDSMIEFRGNTTDWPQTLATGSLVLPGGRFDREVAGGPMRIARVVPGLRVTYRRNPRSFVPNRTAPRRVDVEFVQTVDFLLRLLERGDLDVGVLPVTLNVDERAEARGLEVDSRAGWESMYLDLQGAALARAERVWLWENLDHRVLHESFVRELGVALDAVRGWPRDLGDARRPEDGLQLAASTSDELAGFVQRALYQRFGEQDLQLELVGIDPRTLYGRWAVTDRVDVALRRSLGSPAYPGPWARPGDLEALPLLRLDAVLAWRNGIGGPSANGTIDGPLWNVHTWWHARGNR